MRAAQDPIMFQLPTLKISRLAGEILNFPMILVGDVKKVGLDDVGEACLWDEPSQTRRSKD